MQVTMQRIKMRRRGCERISLYGFAFVAVIGVLVVLAAVEVARMVLPRVLCMCA